MPFLAAVVLAASSKSSSTSTSGSSAASLIFILIIGLAAYFLFIRPRSQAARRQRDTLQELVAGDEVLTGSGIFGTVLDVESDRVTLETAPGTRITVLRSTIARRIPPASEAEPDAWSTPDHTDEDHDAGGGADGDGGVHEHDGEAHGGSAGA